MPLKSCTLPNGKAGTKFGDSGKCYSNKKDAIKQGIAIYGPEKFAQIMKKSKGEYEEELISLFYDLDIGKEDTLSIGSCLDFSIEYSNKVWEEKKLDKYVWDSAKKLTKKYVNTLTDSEFGIILPGGSKDSEGKTVPRSLRKFPLSDKNHVKNAIARLPQSNLTPEQKKIVFRKIVSRAKKYGIKINDNIKKKYS